MPNIAVKVCCRIARTKYSERIVSNNTDYTITFDFDEEWADTDRTARFSFDGGYVDVPFKGDTVSVPSIPSTAKEVKVGVYAGSLRTTSAAEITVVPSCFCSDDTEYIPATDIGIADASELDLVDTVRLYDKSEGKLVKATLQQIANFIGGEGGSVDEEEIIAAINTALEQAKASGEFDGLDGITPTIGDNGNWFLGDTDTEKPSRGDDGKSAYEYAQDGGYTGTEDEFAAKLAAEIPSGGGASGLGIFDNYDVTLISFVLIDQDTLPIEAGIEITTDDNGNPFSYDGIVVWSDIKSGVSYTDIKFNGIQNFYFPFPHGVKNCMSVYVTDGKSMRAIRDGGSNVYIKQTRADINEAFFPVEYIANIPEKLTSVHLCPRNKVTTGTFYKIWGLTKK